MKELRYLTVLLIFGYHSVFGEFINDGSVFSSLRRRDHSGEKTYHFARVNNFTPISEPIIYEDSYNDNSKMIVAFNNMVVFGIFENEKHYVIRVNEDLTEDDTNIPTRFLDVVDSGELFDIVTLKPTATTTPMPKFLNSIQEVRHQALQGFDPDRQSVHEYLQQVSANLSRIANTDSART